MDKLNLDLEFCYGIKKLQKEIDFSCIGTKKRHSYAIYAPNGVMKTSLAKTFKDFANGKQSKDEVFSEKPNKRVINDENGSELQPEEVFVIEPYNEKFTSNKLTTLVAKQELKDLYDNAHLEIDKSKQEFLKKLKHLSGLSGRDNNIVQAIEDTFNKDFFNCLIDLKDKIINETLSFNFSNIIYNEIFTEKVLKFLNTSNFKEDIKQYIENYNELIDKSDFLKKDFNHYNAEKVNKNLKDNGFFKANHSINLNNGQSKQEILDEIDLERVITEEKEKVLNSDQLKSSFNTIDKKLTNVDLVKFRDYLFDNMIILSELANLDNFKKNLWLSYFVDQKALFIDLVDTYEKKRIVIEQIIKDAKEDKTKWENVIKIFNDRFKTPFSVKIRNQEDVILKDDIPSFDFYFADQGTTVAIDKTSLLNVLSQGEKRALYLLNIIFEVEARKSATQKTLFIVDDIADSFDYKNKYAIIEYLKEIGSDPLFKQIILTHNFDFFRTIESRFVGRKQCLMVIKTDSDIKLDDKLYLKPFSYFKNNLHKDNNILIASIPFIRNIIEYCKDEKDSDYKRLTSLLHLKSDTTNIR